MKSAEIWLFLKRIFREMVQWAISSLIALITGLGLVFIVIQLVGWYYDSKHPMAFGEEDLGFGLIAILIFTVSVICVIPIAGFVLWRSKKFISKKLHARGKP